MHPPEKDLIDRIVEVSTGFKLIGVVGDRNIGIVV